VRALGAAAGHEPRFGLPLTAVTVVATVIVASLSYHVVEQPLRRRFAAPRAAAIVNTEAPSGSVTEFPVPTATLRSR
jgi:peptidoglycan/LPS O-acetylase OafA/YrhL